MEEFKADITHPIKDIKLKKPQLATEAQVSRFEREKKRLKEKLVNAYISKGGALILENKSNTGVVYRTLYGSMGGKIESRPKTKNEIS